LFGRVALVLLGGLVAVQVMTTAVHVSERQALVLRSGAQQAAVRVADYLRVLQATGPAERSHVMRALQTDTLKLSLVNAAPDQEAVDEASDLVLATREALALALEPGTDFKVMYAQPVYLDPASWYARMLGERPGVRIRTAVHLNDGGWIAAESTEPPRATSWFIRMLRNLLIVDLAMLVLSFFAVRQVTRPLSVLAGAAEELGRNIDRPPLAEQGATELARAARALNVMQDRLKRYVQTRTHALAAMSHDLKTPITRMRLRAETLEDAPLKAKFIKDFESLQAMVSSTLEYMKGLDDGGEPLRRIDVNALISSLKEDAEESGHLVSVTSQTRKLIMGRAQALKRCLQNLLDNALSYGHRADITVGEEGDLLKIAITDDGPGIPEKEMDRIFEPYYRVEESRNRNSGGSGLGLSIARNIAQAHGGTLQLRNLPGRGLEATLTLPSIA
jgi:signal transduction histidine kinase